MLYTFYGDKTRAATAGENLATSTAKIFEGRVCTLIEADTRQEAWTNARTKFVDYETENPGYKIINIGFREGDRTKETQA